MNQLALFPEPFLEPPPGVVELAARIPPSVRFGTSSWTFEGWKNLVYGRSYPSQKDFVRRSLEEYARFPLFKTVGIDRTFYAPLTREQLSVYARVLPQGFKCVAKVWDELTLPRFPNVPRYGTRAGQVNENFLNPEVFLEQVRDPWLSAMGPHAGPLLFQFTPGSRLDEPHFVEALNRFLGEVGESNFAFELREPSWASDGYLNLLTEYRCTHVINYWSGMPSVREQAGWLTKLGRDQVIRLLLPPKRNYKGQKAAFEPFDKIVEPRPAMRTEVVDTILRSISDGASTFVLVNNKAEGCSPLTIRALADELDVRLRSQDSTLTAPETR